MDDRTLKDEVSLRDLYLVLRRWRGFILACALIAALGTLVVSLLLPKQYQSMGAYSLSLSTEKLTAPLTNLPSLGGLAQGYGNALGTTALSKELGETAPRGLFSAKYDEKIGLWTLTGVGKTPQLAKERAERLMRSARNYVEDRVMSGVRVNIAGTLEQAQLDLAVAEQSLVRIGEALANTPQVSNRDSATTAGLEAQGVNPQLARSINPAFVNLALAQSQFKSQRAQYQARVQTYTDLLKDPSRLMAFTKQALSIQLIAEPTEPMEAISPRPGLYASIAGIMGLFIGLLLPFVIEAVRDPESGRNDTKRTLQSAAD